MTRGNPSDLQQLILRLIKHSTEELGIIGIHLCIQRLWPFPDSPDTPISVHSDHSEHTVYTDHFDIHFETDNMA